MTAVAPYESVRLSFHRAGPSDHDSFPYRVLLALCDHFRLAEAGPADNNIMEAAFDLGAKPHEVLYHVIIPQIKPGIVTERLAFTLSIDDFIISFTTGQEFPICRSPLYSMAKTGINPSMNAISTILFIVIMALPVVLNRRDVDIADLEV